MSLTGFLLLSVCNRSESEMSRSVFHISVFRFDRLLTDLIAFGILRLIYSDFGLFFFGLRMIMINSCLNVSTIVCRRAGPCRLDAWMSHPRIII